MTLCLFYEYLPFREKSTLCLDIFLCKNKNVVLTFDNGMTKQKVYNNRRMQEMENEALLVHPSWLLMHIPKYEVGDGPAFIRLFFTLDREAKSE